MKYESVRFISNGAIKKAVVSKEADFSARRKTFVDVVDVNEKEERRPRTVPWGTPESTGQGSECVPSTSIRWVRPSRKNAEQLRRLLRI